MVDIHTICNFKKNWLHYPFCGSPSSHFIRVNTKYKLLKMPQIKKNNEDFNIGACMKCMVEIGIQKLDRNLITLIDRFNDLKSFSNNVSLCEISVSATNSINYTV